MEISALQSCSVDVSSDIFEGIFASILDHEAFKRWREGNSVWQLHCIGGPGSGKTTLTAVISQHLKYYFKAEGHPIITLQINEDVSDHQTDLLEDFLETFYKSLEESGFVRSDDALESHEKYMDWRYSPKTEGYGRRNRLKLLRKAIHIATEGSHDVHVYLLLDGIDRCGASIRFLLETELGELQKRGVKILLTSRLAVFENDEAECDYCQDMPLSIYMECKTCNEIMCFACTEIGKGKRCEISNDECNFHEPYEHVNIRLAFSDERMAQFVSWDLEREHGDLGLHSLIRPPPLSRLGESLLLNQSTRAIHTIVEDIVEASYENIAIAKARLDLIHEMESLEGLDAKRDQLPTTVTALFDYGLQRIEALPRRQRDMAFKAIASAGRSVSGLQIPDLRALLDFLGISGIRSGEEIVEAAMGWLVVAAGDPQSLQVYNTNFLYHVQQRYHQALHRSSVQIDTHLRRRRAASDDEATGPFSPVRFEPQNISETPGVVTPYKLARTVTAMPPIDEAPVQPFIVRKGTVAWT